MNLSESKYSKYALVREMFETSDIIRKFSIEEVAKLASYITSRDLFLTGEGSSRIFPAKQTAYQNMKDTSGLRVVVEGSLQAMEYNLDKYTVIGSSNSGKTKELILLMTHLKQKGHRQLFGMSSVSDSLFEDICNHTHILSCGNEEAVAATKSVVEQALFYDALRCTLSDGSLGGLESFAKAFNDVLSGPVSNEIVGLLSAAEMIYFAGRNNGVAEELTLKTNEICRKKSVFLEGTYAVHGIEEVMKDNDIMVWIDPIESEMEKFSESLVRGAGVQIIAISSKPTPFPTFLIPHTDRYAEYLQLAAGWNILVETGISCGIDLDYPIRARKIGNEF